MKTDKIPWLGYGPIVAVLLAILYSVGIVGHYLPATLGLMKMITPWFLLLCGGLVVYPLLKKASKQLWLWFVFTYLVTYALEAIGVATGLVFGAYHYGPVLGFAIFGVPLVIAFNWAVVVFGILLILRVTKLPWPLIAIFTGLGATAFDWVMEPVAIKLNYWVWHGGDIPLQNYIAWFAIATLAATAYLLLEKRQPIARPSGAFLISYYVGIQLVFFGALQLLGGL